MGLLINKTDFVDSFALSKSIEDTLDAYIAKYEEAYLMELMGVELFKLFKADVSAGVPQTAPYQALFNKISADVDNYIVTSQGLKSMLLGFIWFEYVRITGYKHTGTGVVTGVNEISRNANLQSGFIYKRYNESINDYKVIQWYICDNSSTYPTYNGQQKNIAGVL